MAGLNQFYYAKPKLLDEALDILERSENPFLLADDQFGQLSLNMKIGMLLIHFMEQAKKRV